MAPTLDPLVPGDRTLTANWTNDPAVGINNAFLFVLNKTTGIMTKLNLTDAEAEAETYVIGDPSMNLINGVEYLVQYVQQQGSPTGDTHQSNTESGIPAGPPSTPVLSVLEILDGGAVMNVHYTGNNGNAYTSVEFRIADTSNNEMSSQYFDFPADAPIPASVSDASYTLTLTNNTPYDIACYVYNEQGSCVLISNTVQLNPTDQPNAPIDFHATSGVDGSVAVDFKNAATQPGGVTVAYYELYKALATGTPSWTLISTYPYVDLSYNVYSYIDNAVTNGIAYQYRVNATSVTGIVGNYTTPVTAVPFKPVEIGNFVVVPGDSEVTCAWTLDITGATFYSPPNIVYYDLQYGVAPAGTADASYTVQYNNLPFNQLMKVINNLTNGTIYDFRVRAKSLIPTALRTYVQYPAGINANLPYAIGAWAYQTGVTPATVPGVPTNLLADVDSGLAQLTWTEPTSTGGSPIISYKVYQYLTAADASNNTNATLVATVIPPVENTTVNGLTNFISYWFRITASNIVGEGPLSAVLGPIIPYDNVNPPTYLDVVQVDASNTYVDVKVTWTSPVPQPAFDLSFSEVFTVSPTGVLTRIGVVNINDYDVSNNDGTFDFSYNYRITGTIPLGQSFAVRMGAVDLFGTTIYSIYSFYELIIEKAPVIIGWESAAYDPLSNTTTYVFNINTFGLNIINATLYNPVEPPVVPSPLPLTIYVNDPATTGFYTMVADYKGSLTSFAFILSTVGGSATLVRNIA